MVLRPVGGSTEPQACEVPDRLLPLAVKLLLAHTCTCPVPMVVPTVAGQVTFMTMCSPQVKLASAGHPPLLPALPDAPALPPGAPPLPVVGPASSPPVAPAAPVLPAAPSTWTLMVSAPASPLTSALAPEPQPAPSAAAIVAAVAPIALMTTRLPSHPRWIRRMADTSRG